MDFSFQVISHNFPYLVSAARWTILISFLGMLVGLLLGIGICAARLSHHGWLRRAAALYISFFRGVPLLVQLLAFFYILPYAGVNLPATVAAFLSIGMCSAAYNAEILRGSLQAISPGQREAADALGIPPLALWRRILVPQALRIGLPSHINELILLVKVSSLASVVGIGELTRVAQNITGQTYRPLEIYMATAVIYFVINALIAWGGRRLERRLGVGQR
ncbi:amino acid ABC transporter permease [Rhodospirillaceae bacterium KN72]|uniref:Amino acid ABC transporter permease n=1 Tax=Pacificispira spongiicola TaxID=2729598 RepID=A0A7Y0DYK1_9PROT|nr:amino acid ABC transporter permease [Pacificispira spongiicola]NMM43171.1 amino acid ABC transporter permease [Pacificispira spongiicola]